MGATRTYHSLANRGLSLRLRRGHLQIVGPQRAITQEILNSVSQYAGEFKTWLRSPRAQREYGHERRKRRKSAGHTGSAGS